MALQLILQTLDGLSADVAKEYVELDDGTFRLDVSGLEDTGALKRAKEHEKNQRKAAQQKATQLESQIEDLQEQIAALGDPSRGSADAVKLQKLEKQLKETTDKLSTREQELLGEISRLTSSAVADRLTSDLTDYPDLMRPAIMSRLRTVMEGGKSVVKVLDADGDEGSMTIDELKKEFENDKRFAPILRGSKGSGSGAPGNGTGGGQTKTKFSEYSGPERVKLMNENPAEFERLRKENR